MTGTADNCELTDPFGPAADRTVCFHVVRPRPGRDHFLAARLIRTMEDTGCKPHGRGAYYRAGG